MNSVLLRFVCAAALLPTLGVCAETKPAAPVAAKPKIVRPGVKTPGVQRQMSALEPEAVFPVEGVPDWLVITDDAVWVSNKPKNTVHRLDPKTNKVAATVTVGQKPCSGIAAGFGSVWVPNCGDNTLSRVDMKTNTVTATIPVGPAHTEGGLAVSADSVWILSDAKGTLSRIDPDTNKVVAEVAVPPGSFACVWGEGAVWVTSTEKGLLARVDPTTNLVTDTIAVGPQPRFLTVGDGSVWTLNQGDGTVARVDAKTRKLISTVEAGLPGPGGEIAFGEGSIWVTVFQIPLTRIDPATNKVVQQWVGAGGDAVRVGHGSVWLSNRISGV
jgi:virginiamycin B lyase